MTTTLFPSRPPEALADGAAVEPLAPAAPSPDGAAADPRWVRPSLIALLVATAGLYLWGLGASGWANSFYSAAAQAGSASWKALFFGSSDASNFITVDKPPAALWVMGLSARIFGVNSWSILAPEALAGVGSVWLLYATVRRWFTPQAGLLAGAVMATTPVAALMFRFNNPDALLVLLLVAAAYAMTRAIERASTRWLMLAWTFVGFGFLTKMLQAFLVLPGFALVYLLAAPTSVRRRVGQLVLAGVALVVSAGWWVAAVELWPKSSRPYIGGSQNNSMLNLIFGYNGFGRLTGDEAGSVGGGGQGAGRWGPTGWTRMFNPEFGGQVSWLLPAALILLVAGLVWRGKGPRTDRARAGYLLWGSWLLVTGIVFSLSKGIIHPYYTVALAPAIGALVGMGATTLWRHRHNFLARAVLAVTVLASAIWAKVLLDRAPNWHPELRTLVLVSGIAVAVAILVWSRWPRSVAAALALTAVAIGLTGPTAYALSTAATTHTGAIPSAGPTVAGGFGRGGMPVGGAAGAPNGVGPGTVTNGGVTDGRGAIDGGAQGQQGTLGQQGAGRTGGIGGLLNGSSPSAELVAVLDADSDSYTWVAATIGANQAAGYQLATGDPVMAIGGFNGTDPWPTLAVFQQYVAEGKIHYFLGGGGIGGGGQGGSSTSSEISAWVAANFTAQTVGGVTLYDLTA